MLVRRRARGRTMTTLFAATYPERTAALVAVRPGEDSVGAGLRPAVGVPRRAAERVPRRRPATAGAPGAFAERTGRASAARSATTPTGSAVTRDSMRRVGEPGDARCSSNVDCETDVREVLPADPRRRPSCCTRTGDGSLPSIRRATSPSRSPARDCVELPGTSHGYMSPDEDDARATRSSGSSTELASRGGRFDRMLATVLFTDIVGLDRAGGRARRPRRGSELVERHHATVASALARYRGVEIDTAGDGFFATFDGPARAVRCAQAIVEAVAPLGIEIRAGVHTGEVEIDRRQGAAGIAVVDRRAGRRARRRRREVLVSQHREGPRRRLRPRVRGRRRARAEGRARPLAPLPGGELMGRLDGKVALITGAGSGMGREACLVFASEGARIAALDVDAAGLDDDRRVGARGRRRHRDVRRRRGR